MTRQQREQIESVCFVISSARRVVEHPGSTTAHNVLRRALNGYDVAHGADPKYATVTREKPKRARGPRLVCPDGGGRCSSRCELAEGCPGPVPAPQGADPGTMPQRIVDQLVSTEARR